MWEVALMAKPGQTSHKRQREVEKAAKAKAKRERRQLKSEDVDPQPATPATQSHEVVLERLADLHRRFEASEISFDAYDEAKAALLRQLTVE
jgi:hypothetical protein